MLDGLAPRAHGVRVLVEPLLRRLENMLVFPTSDPALLGRSCISL